LTQASHGPGQHLAPGWQGPVGKTAGDSEKKIHAFQGDTLPARMADKIRCIPTASETESLRNTVNDRRQLRFIKRVQYKRRHHDIVRSVRNIRFSSVNKTYCG